MMLTSKLMPTLSIISLEHSVYADSSEVHLLKVVDAVFTDVAMIRDLEMNT